MTAVLLSLSQESSGTSKTAYPFTASTTATASLALLISSLYYYYMNTNPFKPPLLMRIFASLAPPGGISARDGTHFLTLKSVKTLVEGTPGKVCPVRTFTFQLPPSENRLSLRLNDYFDLSMGDVVKVHGFPGAKEQNGSGRKPKSYSPTNVSAEGEIDLTVKIYPNGKNSQNFDQLRAGDVVAMSGPWPPIRAVRLGGKFVNIVCFGAGMTEAKEVAKGELEKGCAKRVVILYANRYRDDAFFVEELHDLQKQYPERLQVVYLYSREQPETLRAHERQGRVHAQVLRDVFQLPTEPSDPLHCEQRFVIPGSKKMISETWKHLEGFSYNRHDHSLLAKSLFGGSKRTQKMYGGQESSLTCNCL